MALPSLEDYTNRLIDATDEVVADTIGFRPSGGDWTTKKAHVDYGEALRDINTGRVIDNTITVTVSKRQVADKPGSNTRLTLPKLPGMEFKAINSLDHGDDWICEVERV